MGELRKILSLLSNIEWLRDKLTIGNNTRRTVLSSLSKLTMILLFSVRETEGSFHPKAHTKVMLEKVEKYLDNDKIPLLILCNLLIENINFNPIMRRLVLGEIR